MQIVNKNAKIEYTYNRYLYTELDDNLLTRMLYENATIEHRHKVIKTHGAKNGKGTTYYDICCGFDCETYTDEKLELAYMYIWQFSINSNVIIGRNYEELPALLDRIKSILNPKDNNRLLCLIHNMGYEFSFFRGWLDLGDASQNFLKDRRTPLKLTHNNFVEFRDSMAMCGGNSLKGLAKDYCNTQKCVGDLDYKIPRNSKSYIDETSLQYCDNDVLILSEYSRWVFDNILDVYHKLPLTRTGLLTLKAKDQIRQRYKNTETLTKNIIARSAPDEATYKMWVNYLYRGGFTHACADIVGLEITDLLGVDITSSYPYCMTQKIFPSQLSDPVDGVSVERVTSDIKNGLVSVFIADFSNIRSTDLHSIESKSKCVKLSTDAVIDNGRVYSASNMCVYLTSFDFINYLNYYKWDTVKIYHYQTSETRYLYKHLVVPMLDSYRKKAELKKAGLPYAIPKGEVNSWYGLNCKKLSEDLTQYDNNGFSTDTKKPYEDQICRLVCCTIDGIFISAYARHRLLQFAYDAYITHGTQSIYCDTDSHKFMHPTSDLIDWIETVNKKIRSDNVENIKYFVEYDDCYADLGEWDIEYYPASMYDETSKRDYVLKAKTLGAKRYLLKVSKYDKTTKSRKLVLNQTIAGLPKTALTDTYGDVDKCFGMFDDKLEISCCKLRPAYTDEPYMITVTDADGITDTHLEKSGTALIPANFTMSIDKYWKLFYINKVNEFINDREYRIYG